VHVTPDVDGVCRDTSPVNTKRIERAAKPIETNLLFQGGAPPLAFALETAPCGGAAGASGLSLASRPPTPARCSDRVARHEHVESAAH
jgi:hypothetical protein